MFPKVAPKFFSDAGTGPKNLGKDPAAQPAAAPGAGQGYAGSKPARAV